MKLMYPDADIPVVQMSLVRGLDPLLHLRIGEALTELLETERNVSNRVFTWREHSPLSFSFPSLSLFVCVPRVSSLCGSLLASRFFSSLLSLLASPLFFSSAAAHSCKRWGDTQPCGPLARDAREQLILSGRLCGLCRMGGRSAHAEGRTRERRGPGRFRISPECEEGASSDRTLPAHVGAGWDKRVGSSS